MRADAQQGPESGVEEDVEQGPKCGVNNPFPRATGEFLPGQHISAPPQLLSSHIEDEKYGRVIKDKPPGTGKWNAHEVSRTKTTQELLHKLRLLIKPYLFEKGLKGSQVSLCPCETCDERPQECILPALNPEGQTRAYQGDAVTYVPAVHKAGQGHAPQPSRPIQAAQAETISHPGPRETVRFQPKSNQRSRKEKGHGQDQNHVIGNPPGTAV